MRENHAMKLRVRTTVITPAQAGKFMLASLYVAALSLVSCSGQMGLSGAVRDNFASRMTCPPDQVNVVQRSDIPRHTFFSDSKASPPKHREGDTVFTNADCRERPSSNTAADVGAGVSVVIAAPATAPVTSSSGQPPAPALTAR